MNRQEISRSVRGSLPERLARALDDVIREQRRGRHLSTAVWLLASVAAIAVMFAWHPDDFALPLLVFALAAHVDRRWTERRVRRSAPIASYLETAAGYGFGPASAMAIAWLRDNTEMSTTALDRHAFPAGAQLAAEAPRPAATPLIAAVLATVVPRDRLPGVFEERHGRAAWKLLALAVQLDWLTPPATAGLLVIAAAATAGTLLELPPGVCAVGVALVWLSVATKECLRRRRRALRSTARAVLDAEQLDPATALTLFGSGSGLPARARELVEEVAEHRAPAGGGTGG